MALAVLHLYHHNNWANLRLVEFLEGQPAGVLAAAEPGGYGAVGETLVHLAAAQERYAHRISGEARPSPIRESDGWPGFPRLRESLGWSGPLLLRAAASTQEDAFRADEYQGKPVKLMFATMVTQVINHATEHRVNITTILAARGIDHPELDGWAYGEETWP